MCELFAMSARHPSTISLSLEEFSKHGGLSGPHKDGWGVVWYEDGDARLIKEAHPAATSPCVRFVQDYPFTSSLAMCHIRKATQGDVATRNCQPFLRELGGKLHSFAHNGDLSGLPSDDRFGISTFQPIGETDSEWAFCALLDRLRPHWKHGRPELQARLDAISNFAKDLRTMGPANFLYSDGDVLFVHSHKRHQPDGTVRAPGLWTLSRHCSLGGELGLSGLNISAKDVDQEIRIFASVPLTHEAWTPLEEGVVLAARFGHLVTPTQSDAA